MYNIGIVGIESKHANYFGDIFNVQELFDGYRISAMWCGDDESKSKELSEKINVYNTFDSVEQLIDTVDAVMVLHRRGSQHYDPAMKTIMKGKPIFIDKPFTSDLSQAIHLIELAKKKSVPMLGGSTLKFLPEVYDIKKRIIEEEPDTVIFRYQADERSIYGGLRFYGSHLVELCLSMFGLHYTQVKVAKNNRGIAATIVYPNSKVILNTTSEYLGLNIITIGKKVTHYSIDEKDCYKYGMKAFAKMLQTHKPPIDYDYYIASVKLMEQIIESIN